jgi:hypothetical protein
LNIILYKYFLLIFWYLSRFDCSCRLSSQNVVELSSGSQISWIGFVVPDTKTICFTSFPILSSLLTLHPTLRSLRYWRYRKTSNKRNNLYDFQSFTDVRFLCYCNLIFGWQTHAHPYTHAHTYARTHTWTLTRAHTHTHTHTRARARPYTRTHVHTYAHTNTRTHTRKLTRTHILTHVHMRAHTHARLLKSNSRLILFRSRSFPAIFNPFMPNDLKRRRKLSPLQIIIPVKISVGSVARRDLIPAFKG